MKMNASIFEQGIVVDMRLMGTDRREIQNKVEISVTA
jgi:hypothetical protein